MAIRGDPYSVRSMGYPGSIVVALGSTGISGRICLLRHLSSLRPNDYGSEHVGRCPLCCGRAPRDTIAASL